MIVVILTDIIMSRGRGSIGLRVKLRIAGDICTVAKWYGLHVYVGTSGRGWDAERDYSAAGCPSASTGSRQPAASGTPVPKVAEAHHQVVA